MRSFAIVLLSIALLRGAGASAEELSVPMEYHGQQIQLTGRFEKPAAQGPLPVVILLHNCAGADGSPSLAVWAPCGLIASRHGATGTSAASRAKYALASARRMCSPQPTYSPPGPMLGPTEWPCSGFLMAAAPQFMSPEITRSCVLGANGLRPDTAGSWRVLLFMAAVDQALATRSLSQCLRYSEARTIGRRLHPVWRLRMLRRTG